MSKSSNPKPKTSINDKYRELLGSSDLSDEEIIKFREPIILLAETICGHVWGKKVY